MKNKKIIIAAGTGFIGRSLVEYFGADNDITILTRQALPTARRTRYVQWDGHNTGSWVSALAGADLLINLAGKSVNCRYTEANKKEIFDSRTGEMHNDFSVQVCKLWEQTFNDITLPHTRKALLRIGIRSCGKPLATLFGLPAPTPLLKLGAGLIGTETELLLKSRWVLLQEGFVFRYPQLPEALKDIIAHLPRRAYHLF